MKLRDVMGRVRVAVVVAALASGTTFIVGTTSVGAAELAPEQPGVVETVPAHGNVHEEHHEGGGMPQLNPESFPPQLIWLAITFIALYLLMSRVALPRIGAVLDERRERISDDLDKASQLRQEAESVLAEYEEGLANARSDAQSIARSVADEMAAASAAAQEDLGRELADQTRDAEARIAAAKQTALENVRTIAVDVAQAATARLIGEEVAPAEVEGAVGAAMDRRG